MTYKIGRTIPKLVALIPGVCGEEFLIITFDLETNANSTEVRYAKRYR